MKKMPSMKNERRRIRAAQSVAPGLIGTSSIGSKTRGTRSSSKKFLDNHAEKVRAFTVELNLPSPNQAVVNDQLKVYLWVDATFLAEQSLAFQLADAKEFF